MRSAWSSIQAFYMPMSHTEKRHRQGALLVALQFALLLLLSVLAAPDVLRGAISLGAWIGAGVAIALALWTLRHNRPGIFNIHLLHQISGHMAADGRS
ncbi:hypothetical protein [Rhodoferax sp.]